MPTQQRNQNNWLPWLGLITMVVGIVYTSGQLTSKVQQNTDRITRLEASDSVRNDAVNSTNVRLARIEAKLEILLSEKGSRR